MPKTEECWKFNLPRMRFVDKLRDWLDLPPSSIELKRRAEISKDWGWPPLFRIPTKPPAPPAPPRITLKETP